jgi:hypothetical protein
VTRLLQLIIQWKGLGRQREAGQRDMRVMRVMRTIWRREWRGGMEVWASKEEVGGRGGGLKQHCGVLSISPLVSSMRQQQLQQVCHCLIKSSCSRYAIA